MKWIPELPKQRHCGNKVPPMTILRGRNAILTGANGGLGSHIAEALIAEGVNLFLVGFLHPGLETLASRAREGGCKAGVIAADLRDAKQRERIVVEAEQALGPIDLLINNAGVEYTCLYHELSVARIDEVLGVNLYASMMLAHRLLPGMLERGVGHIVSMSSLAGKSGPAFQEPYAASKAGLTAFTYSLRATYRKQGVSASVIAPGFVEAGIYSRLKARLGKSAPFALGAVGPHRVAHAVVRAIRKDLPEVVISRFPIWPVLAMLAVAPRLGLWVVARLGTHEFFRQAAASESPAGRE